MYTPIYTPIYTPMYTPIYTPIYTPMYTPIYTPIYTPNKHTTPNSRTARFLSAVLTDIDSPARVERLRYMAAKPGVMPTCKVDFVNSIFIYLLMILFRKKEKNVILNNIIN